MDVDFYAVEFAGIANIGRSWELMTPHSGAQVTVPALYMAGDRDLVVAFHGMDKLVPNLRTFVPSCRLRPLYAAGAPSGGRGDDRVSKGGGLS